MPWIRSLKVGLVWISFSENDLHEMSCQRFGFTKNHSRNRTMKALDLANG